MMKSGILVVMFLALLIPANHAQTTIDFNPKAIDTITLRITQRGILEVDGSVQRANLTLYIPQDGVETMDVSSSGPMSWSYSTDRFGNRVAVLKWDNPSGSVTYELSTVVKSGAKFVRPASGIGHDATYLQPTDSIVFTDEMRSIAYPYEKSWGNVAKLTAFVYDYVAYDINMVGQRQDSAWVLDNKRGVCVEHANLLTSLLRVSDIPARYVVGYAYSSVDKQLIGHTWVEVLSDDGTWIPFDPTWLEGGYLDATHIRTANLLDDEQIDVLSYVGTGKITWRRGDSDKGTLYADEVEIISYKEKNLSTMILTAPAVPLGSYGYVKSTVKSNVCTINQININPCVDSAGNDAFEVYEPERKFFSCGDHDVYWFYKEMLGDSRYNCPVTVFDQIGSHQAIDVETRSARTTDPVSITGPDVANLGETFTLFASAGSDFIFYSPEFGRRSSSAWPVSANRTGDYKFYLFSGNNLATKTVKVVQKKEFEVYAEGPLAAAKNQMFGVNVTVKNLDTSRSVGIGVRFGTFSDEKSVFMNGNEEKTFTYMLNASEPGRKQLVASATGNTYVSYTLTIDVEDPDRPASIDILGLIDRIIEFIKNLIAGLTD